MNRITNYKLLSKGDVIKTNPFPGYWGCGIVLTDREKTNEYDPMCLIGIMDIVFTHDYLFEEINFTKLKILQSGVYLRTDLNEYKFHRKVICIGIYSRKMKIDLKIIGKLGVFPFPLPSLSFAVGDGSDGRWPMCGSVENSLGFEAVHTWRSIHDKENWEKDILKARKSHEDMLLKLKKKKL